MSPIPWDPTLETGHALVDTQHRGLHDLFNEAESAVATPALAMRILDRMLEHASMHFSAEEELMRQVAYPPEAADAHILEHRQLTQDARDRVMAYRSGTLEGMDELIGFLRVWVAEHIHEHDRAFIDFYRANA